MSRRIYVSLMLCLLTTSTYSFEQTYESCALSAYSNFDAIKSYILEVPLEKASQVPYPENIAAAYKLSKELGINAAYITVHVKYKQCAKSVKDKSTLKIIGSEVKYRACAYKSAVRTNILLYLDKGMKKSEIREKIPKQHDDLIDLLYSIHKEASATKAAHISANAHRSCVYEIDSP